MLIVVAGGLGEVGSSIAASLVSLGHEVVRVSARQQSVADDREGSLIGVEEAARLLSEGRVDLLINASGPGDRRGPSATWRDTSRLLSSASREAGTRAVLLSTTRVMEGYGRDYEEGEPPLATTEYARLNAENESVWCASGEDRATVLRISNFFCRPQGRESPQVGLLPWSLAAEARDAGTITMRSGANLVKDFVTGADVAAAALLLAERADAPRVCATSPGAGFSLGMLAEETACAIEQVSGSRPVVSFGPDGDQAPRCSPSWLAELGWSSSLTAGGLREEIETWLRDTSVA